MNGGIEAMERDRERETAVPLLAEDEERRRLERLESDPPALVVVVSDLHLGKGVDAMTDRYFRRENFFADAAFQRFVCHHLRQGSGTKLLVLNGDILDFLRIDDWPQDAASRAEWTETLARLGAAGASTLVTGHERRFGLHTDPAKSVYKLRIIARGHPVFFAGLAEWVVAGGTILYVKGNHDVEQHWPLIRRALRDEIHRAGAPADAVAEQVVFADDATTLANLHIEHGHTYETITRVAGPAELGREDRRLSLPLGSFVNRYIINRMERVEPFLDNIKPVTDVLRAMVRRQPLAVFGIIWNGTWFLFRALAGRRVRHALLSATILAAAATYLVPPAVLAAVLLYFASPAFHDWVTRSSILSDPAVRVGASVAGTLLPLLVRIGRGLWHELRRPKGFEDHFAAGVYGRLAAREIGRPSPWRRRYAVLGHTHQQDVQALPALGGAPLLYLNSGTWTPLWPSDRPDLIGRVFHSFLRFQWDNGEYVHETLVWDDEMNRPRASQLLAAS
ncbi:MAG: hypothetical protein ACREMF_02010 [Gemmatimonadales bacterium]